MGYSANKLYQMFQNGQGSYGLSDTSFTADDQAYMQQSINDKITSLNQKMSASWTGNASDGAQTGATPLVQAAKDASQTLGTTQQLTQSQADSFDVAKMSMNNVPEQAPQYSGMNSVLHTLGIPNSTDSAVSQYNNESSANVAAYNEYNDASTYNAENMPTSYGAIQAENASISVVSPTSVGGGPSYTGTVGLSSSGGGGNYNSLYTGSSGPSYTGSVGPGGSNNLSSYNPTGNPTPTNTSSWELPTGPNGTLPTGPTGGLPNGPTGGGNPYVGLGLPPGEEPPPGWRIGPGGEWIGPNGQVLGPNGQPLGPNGQPLGPNGEPLGPNGEPLGPNGEPIGGGGGAGGFGGAGGAGGSGSNSGLNGMRSGLGSGSGSSGSAAEGAGARSGLGMSPEEAAMRGGAAGAPGEGGGPGGMGGGRGGKREDDKEHQTASYLQEADPDALFGTDQLTAPPVIGD